MLDYKGVAEGGQGGVSGFNHYLSSSSKGEKVNGIQIRSPKCIR